MPSRLRSRLMEDLPARALGSEGRGDGCAPHHDLVLAITSHLPHLIAYNIVGTADGSGRR